MTNSELQTVVDAARSLQLLGGANVKTAHCAAVIETGRVRGIVPASDDELQRRFVTAVTGASA